MTKLRAWLRDWRGRRLYARAVKLVTAGVKLYDMRLPAPTNATVVVITRDHQIMISPRSKPEGLYGFAWDGRKPSDVEVQ